jgi:hypothetical protein
MDAVERMLLVLDPYIILLFRMTGDAMVNFLIGTFVLAMMTVVFGEFTLSLALRFNRRHIQGMEQQLSKQHDLSMTALQMNDQEAYKACNKQANDTFGKYFFSMIAHSAACLWPVPFALAWMQLRFHGVELELAYPISLFWQSTNYFTVFIALYILSRILFRHVRRYLPYFRGVQQALDSQSSESRKFPSLSGS